MKKIIYALAHKKTGEILIYAGCKMSLKIMIKSSLKTFKGKISDYKVIAGVFEEIEMKFGELLLGGL